MIPLVDLEEAKAHLRVDIDDDDFDIKAKLLAASAAVLNYVKSASVYEPAFHDGLPVLTLDGKPVYTTTVRYEVQAAVLLMLGYLHRDRDGDPDGAYEVGMLPRPVMALLYPLRTPTLA